MNSELQTHIEYLTGKSIKFKEVDDRYAIGVKRWFLCGGDLPSNEIAKYLDINHNKLTLLIQKQMSKITGVELKNEAPNIEVEYTKMSLDLLYPKSYRFDWQPVYELNYYLYLANNSRGQIIDNYKVFLNESRNGNIQGGCKIPDNQISKINF